jgi:hypothetical protein
MKTSALTAAHLIRISIIEEIALFVVEAHTWLITRQREWFKKWMQKWKRSVIRNKY